MLIKPKIRIQYNWNYYLISEVEDFFKQINFEKGDVKDKILYLSVKNISQNKLREVGFTITRNKDKADVIVIDNLVKRAGPYYGKSSTQQTEYRFSNGKWGRKNCNTEEYFDELYNEQLKKYNYIYSDVLYKYLYKYDGNLELFNQCNDLLRSGSRDNTQMAMEFMSNANWEGNELYIQELFNLYWNDSIQNIRGNKYKSSISFRGFLESLDFKYENLSLIEANDYRQLCKTEEHHNWIYRKYEDLFKEELDELVKRHKIQIDELKYSIDKKIIYNKEEE